jgi:hypothetical protein
MSTTVCQTNVLFAARRVSYAAPVRSHVSGEVVRALRFVTVTPNLDPASCVSVTYYTWLEQGRDITDADGFVE